MISKGRSAHPTTFLSCFFIQREDFQLKWKSKDFYILELQSSVHHAFKKSAQKVEHKGVLTGVLFRSTSVNHKPILLRGKKLTLLLLPAPEYQFPASNECGLRQRSWLPLACSINIAQGADLYTLVYNTRQGNIHQ